MNPPTMGPRPRSPEQFAGAYAFADRIVVVTYARVPDGSLIQGLVCFTVRLPAKEGVLGYAVLQALESFLPESPVPPDHVARRKKQLKALGVRDERQLQRHALYCALRHAEGAIGFQPTHNGGHKGDQKGYQPIPAAAFAVPASTEIVEIGAALRHAFKLGTTVFE